VITDAPADPAEALLGKRAIGARLRTSVRTLERLMASGELPAIRLDRRTTRFAPTDVDALIERRRDST
jgi:excisionase family DNA binding protein